MGHARTARPKAGERSPTVAAPSRKPDDRPSPSAGELTPEGVLGLQRAAGNRAVSALLQRTPGCSCGGGCASCRGSEEEKRLPTGGLVIGASDEEEIGFGVGGLTTEEKALDLVSSHFKGNDRLQQAFDNSPVLHQGESGDAVLLVQEALLALNFTLPNSTKNGAEPPDGKFGPETANRIRLFQRFNGIPATGDVGRMTLMALEQEESGRTAPGASATATITATDVSAQSFSGCGRFDWSIHWSTTGVNGFIVQEITNSYDVQDATGASTGEFPATPHYWEAWHVDGNGKVDPRNGTVHDTFHRVTLNNRMGSWHMQGNVFWVDHLDANAGYQFGGVQDAGILLSTLTEPADLGTPLLVRDVGGEWDCTDPDPANHFHNPT